MIFLAEHGLSLGGGHLTPLARRWLCVNYRALNVASGGTRPFRAQFAGKATQATNASNVPSDFSQASVAARNALTNPATIKWPL